MSDLTWPPAYYNGAGKPSLPRDTELTTCGSTDMESPSQLLGAATKAEAAVDNTETNGHEQPCSNKTLFTNTGSGHRLWFAYLKPKESDFHLSHGFEPMIPF